VTVNKQKGTIGYGTENHNHRYTVQLATANHIALSVFYTVNSPTTWRRGFLNVSNLRTSLHLNGTEMT